MLTKEFDFDLPRSLIAQEPLPERDKSRLLVVNRKDGSLSEKVFRDVTEYFSSGDVLVLNNSRVIPARMFCFRKTGAKIEILLLEKMTEGKWEVLVKPAKRVRIGEKMFFPETDFTVRITERSSSGKWTAEFSPKRIDSLMLRKGVMPTPPYIKKELNSPEKYQTVFSKRNGSVACPTSGLHFTESLIGKIKEIGVKVVFVTLHIGVGTFRPIKAESLEEHYMDSEYLDLSEEAASVINSAKDRGAKIFACGTSSVRTLESQADSSSMKVKKVLSGIRKTDLFIRPGYKFKIVDCLITNFHLPRSTNLVLAGTFLGKELLKKAYKKAVEDKFRFYSFGDAMLAL